MFSLRRESQDSSVFSKGLLVPINLGIIWPEAVAPFKYHLLNLSKSDKVKKQAEDIYQALFKKGTTVLFDDRPEISPGAKLQDADLLGLPYRLIVSDKTNGRLEFKPRNSIKTELKEAKDIK